MTFRIHLNQENRRLQEDNGIYLNIFDAFLLIYEKSVIFASL